MGLGTNHITTTTHANFIPEMWSDEVIGAYKANLVLANLVTNLPHQGKKGDTVHVPNGTRGAASAKAASTQVVLITATEGKTDVSINKHYEYSRLIEDIVGIQALDSFRAFYTDDAGYALAKQVDTDLHAQLESLQGGAASGTGAWAKAVAGADGSTLYDQTANTNTGNGSALADAGLRKMIQTLDDVDVPLSERVLVIPPVEKKNLMGLARFTEQAFTGEAGSANTIRNGLIGDIYGVPVYVSTNVATETAADTSTLYRIGALMHRSALVHVEQMNVRSQTQYKQEYLADLFTADTIYGVAELRNDAGIAIALPA